MFAGLRKGTGQRGRRGVTKVQMALVRERHSARPGRGCGQHQLELELGSAVLQARNVVPHVMGTSADECVRRNALREDRVPDGVIERMASKPACALHTHCSSRNVLDTSIPIRLYLRH